ncbi:MAG: GNAT family N-acetyltransferase [Phycisphaerales bacterium]|nr:GNAT family N-acetyltransferase [Hyphomonadaceae bacterium]
MRDVIETNRLKLRMLRMKDAQRVAGLCGDPAVARMIARAPLPYLPIAAEGWIMTLAARKPLGADFVYAVDLDGEGLIGAIGAHKVGETGFEAGYWFGRPYWGRGYATEALTAFLEAAGNLGPLQAGHFVDNPASGRVLEKTGFAYTGEVKPLFSLARGESVLSKRMRFAEAAGRGAGERAAVAA